MAVPASSLSPARPWFVEVQDCIEQRLAELLASREDEGAEPRWERALEEMRSFALRPGKRLRPVLVLLAHQLVAPTAPVASPALLQFAAGFELLHTFLLIHDDVADRATLRRGEPALHRRLAEGRVGEDLAVVVGDYLFARALEVMLGSGLPRAARAVEFYLGICRQTAVGQYLDLDLSRAPFGDVSLFQTLKVAYLKTARYGFVAPLVCGAMLGGASEHVLASLSRVGRHWGLAYQMQDDLMGLFGDAQLTGKAGDGDFAQRKRTFPAIAAYTRAPPAAREELARLWEPRLVVEPPAEHGVEAERAAEELARARELVQRHGGRSATDRVIVRSLRAAHRALGTLPQNEAQRLIRDLMTSLAEREA